MGDVQCLVEYPLGNFFSGQPDRVDPVAVDEFGGGYLYNDPSSADPSDIALRVGNQV